MNLRSLSDQSLLLQTESLVRAERELLTKVLHHFREIEERKLYSSLGYTSLYHYAVQKLGYSADQAGRRVAAMRLVKTLPQIEEQLETRALNLTTVSMAQSLFRKENIRPVEQVQILAQVENKSTREAEKILLAHSKNPSVLKPDRIRAVADQQMEIRFVADAELNSKIEQLRGLLAHRHPSASLNDLFHIICEVAIEKLSPEKQNPRPRTKSGAPMLHGVSGRRTIPVNVRRYVWKRAKGECQNCGSRYALEIDHVRPVALGGGNEEDNLRLLCRPCNRRAAIVTFGRDKIENNSV